jgi:hypothetical protein
MSQAAGIARRFVMETFRSRDEAHQHYGTCLDRL